MGFDDRLDPITVAQSQALAAGADYLASRGKPPTGMTYAGLILEAGGAISSIVALDTYRNLGRDGYALMVSRHVLSTWYYNCENPETTMSDLGVYVAGASSPQDFLSQAARLVAYNWFGNDIAGVSVSFSSTDLLVRTVHEAVPDLATKFSETSNVVSTEPSRTRASGTPPPPPLDLNAFSLGWSSSPTFLVAWSDPPHEETVSAAWYSFSSPSSPEDGVRVEGVNPAVVRAPSEGASYLYVWLEDSSGDADHAQAAVTRVRYDGTPPEVTISSPASSIVTVPGATVDLTGSAGDQLSGVYRVAWLSSPAGAAGFVTRSGSSWTADGIPLLAGENRVTVVGTDVAGNIAASTLTVESEAEATAYRMAVAVNGAGTVILDPDRATYPDGSTVTLTAEPDNGYRFDEWRGDVGGAANPLTLTMDSDKSITASFVPDGTETDEGSLAVRITPDAAVTAGAQWRYGGEGPWYDSGEPRPISFVDSENGTTTAEVTYRQIPGWIAPAGERFQVRAGEDRVVVGAPYTRVRPVEDGVLLASGGRAGDRFGQGVDFVGGRALVASGAGVYAFVLEDTVWRQDAVLSAPDGRVRAPIALSDRHGGLAAARRGETVHTLLYQKADATYVPLQSLRSSDFHRNDGFGFALDIDETGDTVLVGAPFDQRGGSTGSAYVFDGVDGGDETQKLVPNAPSGTREFGAAVAIDRRTAVVVAAADGTGDRDAPAAFVFVREGAEWGQLQLLQPETGVGFAECFEQGECVDIDGSTVVVGAPERPAAGASDVGAVFVYERAGELFELDRVLTASDGEASDRFGRSVSVSGDMIVVGASSVDDAAGASYVFQRVDGEWVESHKLVPDDAEAGDGFGSAVAVDRGQILIGAPGDRVGLDESRGSVRYLAGLPVPDPPAAPVAVVGASSLAFGAVQEGQAPTRSFDVTNAGGGTLGVTVSYSGDPAFSVTGGAGPHTLGAGESVTVTVTFAPYRGGDAVGTVTVAHDAPGGGGAAEVAVTGTGTLEGAAAISMSTDPVAFGDIGLGQTVTRELIVSSQGYEDLVGSVSFETESAALTLVEGVGAFELAPGDLHVIRVRFAPTAEEAATGVLRVAHNAEGVEDPLVIDVSGTGRTAPTEPALSLSATALKFGSVGEGEAASRGLVLTNGGGGTVGVDVSFAGDRAFSVTGGVGPRSLGAGESLTVAVTYAPDGPGDHSATVTVEHDAPNVGTPIVVALTGRSASDAVAAISMSTEAVNFGAVPLDGSSARGVRIANGGGARLTGTVTLDAGSPAFALTEGGGAFALGPGGERVVTVTFAPSATGAYSAALRVEHDAPGTDDPVVVALTGEGTAATPSEAGPGEVAVSAVYPNPLGSAARIDVDLPAPATVALDVFDVLGRRVLRVPEHAAPAGRGHRLVVRPGRLPSGAYPYRVTVAVGGEVRAFRGVLTVSR